MHTGVRVRLRSRKTLRGRLTYRIANVQHPGIIYPSQKEGAIDRGTGSCVCHRHVGRAKGGSVELEDRT